MINDLQENPIIKIKSISGNALYFLGARHTNDPSDVQFDKIKNLWSDFLENTEGERIIFIESIIHNTSDDFEDSVRKYGEAGAVFFLARKAGLGVIKPEPTAEEQRRILCGLFDKEIVVYTMIIQNLSAWSRLINKSNFNDVLKRTLHTEKEYSEIYGFTPDITWFKKQHRKLFGKQEIEDRFFLNNISNPRKSDTQINIVASHRTKVRNEYIINRITEAWNSGKNIFIVYGKGHLSILEDELQKLK